MKVVEVPSIEDVITPLLNVQVEFEGDTYTIKELRISYLKGLNEVRKMAGIEIFIEYASALLERQMRGESYNKRIEIMREKWRTYEHINENSIKEVLKEARYRFHPQGAEVLLELKKLTGNDFNWEYYFKEAEKNYENNFQNDPFLKIKYIGYKVRDFALSEFSNYYLANDLHVIKMIKRTGLLINGYGDVDIGTNPSDESEYLFLKRLIVRLSKESGWEERKGYSPGEIDKIFWHFGRNICKKVPECNRCPIVNVCLTGRSRGGRN